MEFTCHVCVLSWSDFLNLLMLTCPLWFPTCSYLLCLMSLRPWRRRPSVLKIWHFMFRIRVCSGSIIEYCDLCLKSLRPWRRRLSVLQASNQFSITFPITNWCWSHIFLCSVGQSVIPTRAVLKGRGGGKRSWLRPHLTLQGESSVIWSAEGSVVARRALWMMAFMLLLSWMQLGVPTLLTEQGNTILRYIISFGWCTWINILLKSQVVIFMCMFIWWDMFFMH